MVEICNKKDIDRNSSIDSLLDIGNSWVERFSNKLVESGFKLSEREKRNLYFGAEVMVYCYRDMPRSSEKAYAFEHPLAINDVLLDAYNGVYRSKSSGDFKIIPPQEFVSCFSENYLEFAHTSFFHDTEELGLFSCESVREFYNGLKMNGERIASNVNLMSFPNGANLSIIGSKLNVLKKHTVPLYCKIGDTMHNSETRGSDRQFSKMTDHYNRLIRENFRSLYPHFYRNICNNYLDKIINTAEKKDMPQHIVDCVTIRDKNRKIKVT